MFPDGRRVVSASDDRTLKVWNVETRECVATLEGHSGGVRCGVHCTLAMICLRRRSGALPCFRTGVASCLGQATTRSRSGTWRPANAWRRWKGTRIKCGARRPLYFRDDVSSSQVLGVAVFPDGRRVVSGSGDKTLRVWDVATGECVATLKGHSSHVRCGVHCTFVMISLRRRSTALPSPRTGGASCLGRATRRSRSGTWQQVNAWGRWKGIRIGCVARRPLYFRDDLASS